MSLISSKRAAYAIVTMLAIVSCASAQVAVKEPSPVDKADPAAMARARAVEFLRREVPRWQSENKCYSCHNNGDATRALLMAGAQGHDIGAALDDTLGFLKQPKLWDQNKAPGGLDDKVLARVQFASAVAVAERLGRAASIDVAAAADVLVTDQAADGSWTLDQSQSLGSPATYGAILATASARATLIAGGRQPDDFYVVQADRWLRSLTVENVVEASSVLIGLDQASDVMAENLRREALSIVRTGQAPDGGWGPYVTAAPQVFDTALAVLALSTFTTEPRLARSTYRPEELKDAIDKGKAYLVSQQRPDGSWPETTRPAGQASYAQRISTSAWALLALLK